ncbi:hypothetical protein ABIF86_000189 [Bradyrhizobium japonicum]
MGLEPDIVRSANDLPNVAPPVHHVNPHLFVTRYQVVRHRARLTNQVYSICTRT